MTSTEPHRPEHGVHGDDDPMNNPDVAHEDSDIDVATVLKAAAGLLLTVVVCAVIVRVIFGEFTREAAARDPKLSPLARPAGQLPPGPRLIEREPEALATFHAEEMKQLDGYGWVNQLGGVAHIPIADAKKLLASRGLPVRASASGDASEGTHRPAYGEASGGRTIKSQPQD